MIVAIANKGREVTPHFGHSDGCTIYFIENQLIIGEKYIENSLMKMEEGVFGRPVGSHKKGGCSCRFFADFLLDEIQTDVLVTGDIGAAASQLFSKRGVNVIAGVKGKIDEYLHAYVKKAG